MSFADRDEFVGRCAKEPDDAVAPDLRRILAAAVKVVTDNARLWRLYGGLLATLLPEVYEEVVGMARKKELLDVLGLRPVIASVPRKEVIKALGLKQLIAEVGVKEWLANLTPEQRAEALRELQQPPSGAK